MGRHFGLIQAPSENSPDLHAVCRVPSSGDTVYYAVGDGEILRIERDGGNWSYSPISHLYGISAESLYVFTGVDFYNEEIGIICGYSVDSLGVSDDTMFEGVILYTTNGGWDWYKIAVWDEINEVQPVGKQLKARVRFLSVKLYSDTSAWIGGDQGVVVKANDLKRITENTWKVYRPSKDFPPQGRSFYNYSGDAYHALGIFGKDTCYVGTDQSGLIARTFNGGETWECFILGGDKQGDPLIKDIDYGGSFIRDSLAYTEILLNPPSFHNNVKVLIGCSEGKVLYLDKNNKWCMLRPMRTAVQYSSSPEVGIDTTQYIMGIMPCEVLLPDDIRESGNPDEYPDFRFVGTSGHVGTFIWDNSGGEHINRVDWYSKNYHFEDIDGKYIWTLPPDSVVEQDSTVIAKIESNGVAVGTNGVILGIIENYYARWKPADSLPSLSGTFYVRDDFTDNGWRVKIFLDPSSTSQMEYRVYSLGARSDADCHAGIPNGDITKTEIGRETLGGDETAEIYWPNNNVSTMPMPGLPIVYAIEAYRNGEPVARAVLNKVTYEGDNYSTYPAFDEIEPDASQIDIIPIADQQADTYGRSYYLTEDKDLVEIWWPPITFEEDTSIIGYLVCPVAVNITPLDINNPENVEVTYTYTGDDDSPPTGYTMRMELPPIGIDPIKLMIIYPPPPPPTEHNLVTPVPVLTNRWFGWSPVGNYYYLSVKPVDIANNCYENGEAEENWSEWILVRGRKTQGIKERREVRELRLMVSDRWEEEIAIFYTIPERKHVSIGLYDLSGRIIKKYVDKELDEGEYSFTIKKEDLSNGIYFIRLSAGDRVLTEKLIISK